MKKKFYILLCMMAVFAFTSINTVSAQFPCWSYSQDTVTGDYTWNGTNWWMIAQDWRENNFVAPGKSALTFYGFDTFDPADGLDGIWDLIPASQKADKYVMTSDDDVPTSREPISDTDFSAEIKGLYDAENLYILIKTTDNEIIDGKEALEIFWASYKDFLPVEDWPFTPACTESDEHVIAIWGNRGAGKSGAIRLTETDTIKVPFDAWLFDPETGEQTWASPTAEELGVEVFFEITGNTTWEAIVVMNIDKFFSGFVAGEEGDEFSLETRVVDVDTDELDIKANFSSTSNNSWWSTYDMGHGVFGPAITSSVSSLTNSNLYAYPNPASSFIVISENVSSAKLINMNGSVVYQGNSRKIDVNQLPREMYIIQLIGYNNSVSYQKMILR